jgi:hypothetical protein
MNILLDKLPTEYQGYKLSTDFRVGIALCNLLDDYNKSDDDKLDDAIDLLWGSGVPTILTDDGILVDYELVYKTINWFISGGNPKEEGSKKDNKNSEIVKDIPYDFDTDADFIVAAFIQQYNIDLTETDMHWFKFLALFKSLTNTVFNRIQEIRTQDPLDIPAGKARAAALKQKEAFKITKVSPQRKAELEAVFGDEWEQHI